MRFTWGRRQKFYTLVIDLDSGRIIWVAPGRGAEVLRKFWRLLRLSKVKVKAVTVNMSAAYWAAVKENLPEAAVAFDHFQIIKLVAEKLNDLRRALVREAIGLMKKTVKSCPSANSSFPLSLAQL